MVTVGRSATTYLTLPLLGAGVAAFKAAMSFEEAFTRIAAVSNASAKDIARWRAQIQGLAEATARDPIELANALYFLASAGLKSKQVFEVLEMSAKAAAVGLGETADVARLVAQALNAYAKSGLTAKQATDVLVAAVKAGTAEPNEFADAMGRILPIAAKAGVSFDQVAASLAGLSNIGLDVNEGVTAMRGLLASMVAPTVKARNTLKDLGLSADDLRKALREGGLLKAMQLLEERSGGNLDVLSALVPNIRALTGQLGLTGENAKAVAGIFDDVRRSSGALGESFKETTDGPAFQFRQSVVRLKNTLIDLGNTIIPLFNQHVAPAIQTGVKWFGNLSDSQKELLVKVALLAAALGPTSMLIGGLFRLISLPLRAVGSLLSLGTALSGVGSAAAAASGGSALGRLLPMLARFPALAAGLAAVAGGFHMLTAPDLKKVAEELGLVDEQMRAIKDAVVRGGFEESYANYWKSVATWVTKGHSQAAAAAAQAMVDVLKELVATGTPAALAQERINLAFLKALPFINGTKDGLEKFKESLRTWVGLGRDSEGQLRANAFAFQAAGKAVLSSDKALGAWNYAVTRARLAGDGFIDMSIKQGRNIAALIQRLHNMGGELTKGEKGWLAMHLQVGDYRKAVDLVKDVIKRFQTVQVRANEGVEQTVVQFRTAHDAAKAYDKKIRGLPKEAKTLFYANTTQAERDILRYRAILYSLPSTINTRLYVTPKIGGRQVAEGGIVRAQTGLVTRGPTILAGEGNYPTFAGKGAEMVTPLDSRGIGIMARAFEMAMQRAGQKGSAPPEVFVKVMLSDRQLDLLVERIVVDVQNRAERAVGAEI